MDLLLSSISIEALKEQAKRLRRECEASGNPISHSKSLELTAHKYHFKDWNTLRAVVASRAQSLSLAIDQRVQGQYLGILFDGKVLKFQELPEKGRYRLTLLLDTPIDVVRFDSFSAYRKRISATIGNDGSTVEKMSNGCPQLKLLL